MPEDPRLTEIKKWTAMVVEGVTHNIAAFLQNRPPQQYNVTRIGPNGVPAPQTISLPQAVCELTDQMRIENGMRQIDMDLQRSGIEAMVKLREEIERNRKVGEKMLRRHKKEDEEEE